MSRWGCLLPGLIPAEARGQLPRPFCSWVTPRALSPGPRPACLLTTETPQGKPYSLRPPSPLIAQSRLYVPLAARHSVAWRSEKISEGEGEVTPYVKDLKLGILWKCIRKAHGLGCWKLWSQTSSLSTLLAFSLA